MRLVLRSRFVRARVVGHFHSTAAARHRSHHMALLLQSLATDVAMPTSVLQMRQVKLVVLHHVRNLMRVNLAPGEFVVMQSKTTTCSRRWSRFLFH